MDAQPSVPPGVTQNPEVSRPEVTGARANSEQVVPRPAVSEQAPVAGQAAGSAVPQAASPVVDPMTLVMAQATPSAAPAAAAATPMPNLAADVDVIEPEWVNKAEAVVQQHVGDPYGEEEAVEELQESYLQQRYGLNVHEPGEDTTNTNSA